MNTKTITAGIVLLISLIVVKATNIAVPNCNFQNDNAAVVPPPILGANSGNIGTWSAGFTNLLGADGEIAASNAVTAGWPTPPGGSTYELSIALPASVEVNAGISEALTNHLQANSVYTLTVDISQQASINLATSAALNLYAVGSTNLASLSGSVLTNILNASNGFVQVTLTYKTPNVVPTNTIGISFTVGGIASVHGNLYLDNFQLSVNPIQLHLASLAAVGHNGANSTMTISGQGGTPGATYHILTTTNILVAPTIWTDVMTNQFDTNGNFSQMFTIDPSKPYQFFRTVVP